MNIRCVGSEDSEQEALFAWASWKCRGKPYEELQRMYAIPNGGLRNARTAVTLKRTGVKAGVPDVFLPAKRQGYGGMYIEMKRRKGGVVSQAQKEFMADLISYGYYVKVCHGFDEARDAITEYLEM